MKFKLIAFLLLCFCANSNYAQKQFAPPIEKDWNDYFFSKEKAIRTKLFHLALEGKLKAYRNDSMARYFSLEELKNRGNFEIVMNEEVANIPLNANKLEHFWFVKTITTSPFEPTESNQLKGIAITFSPVFGSIIGLQTPFCWFAPQDVKNAVTNEDYNWLMLIYHYTKNDNTIRFRELGDYDAFWEINHVKNSYNFNIADSQLYKKISVSLSTSYFYINDIIRDVQMYSAINSTPIYDQQTKQSISFSKFETDYRNEIVVFIQTDVNDPTVGKDSIITQPFEMMPIKNYTVNTTTSKITAFNYEFYVSGQAKKTYRFSIEAEFIRNLNITPAVFWFFEDYFRWKSK